MDVKLFIENFRKAFGKKTPLPIAVWYSQESSTTTERLGGCLFKHLPAIQEGESVSLNADNIACGGGKFYCGFSDMPEHIPNFVSTKERYKQHPEQVLDMIKTLRVVRSELPYLNLSRIDNLESFDRVEALLFLATPDVLSGLTSWTFFDRNESDVVSAHFGSGCSCAITEAVNENAARGYRSFLGFFDPSVRPYVESNILAFAIPMSRFSQMSQTMLDCCLFDTHAWNKVLHRINES